MTDPTARSTAKRRRRWRRLSILVGALPLLLALAAQLVLWSDLPRRWLEAFLSDRSGLDVRLTKLTLRWGGHTTAGDVTLALPASDPFAAIPQLDLEHDGLLKLVVGRPLDLIAVDVRDATLTLRTDDPGVWELQRVIETLSDDDGSDKPIALPVIRLDRTTILLDQAGDPEVAYAPVAIYASTPRPGRLSFAIGRGQETSVRGEVTLDASLEHEATFRFDKAIDELQPWLRLRDDARLAGTWSGALDGEQLTGRLRLEDAVLLSKPLETDLAITAGDHGRGPIALTGTVTSRGTGGGAEYQAEIRVDAQGESWTDLQCSLVAEQLQWTDRGGALVLDGLGLQIDLREKKLTLHDLNLPRARSVSADGEYDLGNGKWSARATIEQWDSPRFANEKVDVEFDLSGKLEATTIKSLRVHHPPVDTSIRGTFARSASPPLQIRQVATIGEYEPRVDPSGEPEAAARVDADIEGTLFPLKLRGQGRVSTVRVPMVTGLIDEIATPCTFEIDNRRISFEAGSFSLFDGTGNATGRYGWDDRLLAFTIAADGFDLATLLPMVDAPFDAGGRLGATIDFKLPEVDTEQLTLAGDWSITDYRQAIIAADRGRGRVLWEEGKLRFDDCQFEYEEGALSGTLAYDSADDRVDLALTANRWPVTVPDSAVRLLVDGSARGSGSRHRGVPRTDLNLTTTTFVDGVDTGSVALRGVLDDQSLHVQQLDGSLAGGQVSGSGIWPLTDWRLLDGTLRWDAIDLAALAPVHWTLAGLAGRATGSANAAPSNDQRFSDTVALVAHTDIADGRLDEATLRSAHVDAFLGNRRQSIQRADIEIAGGSVGITGWHDSSRSHTQLFFTVDALDCSELEAVFLAPDRNRLVGRLAGRGSFTSSAPSDTFLATASFELTEADIASSRVVRAIYDGLRLGLSGTEPKGRGTATARLEGTTLEVSDVKYLNRGVGISGRITLDDITAGGESQISGVAVGALRPLADINLPVIRQLDTLTQWFQGVTSSVRVSGTAGSPRVRPVPFAQVADEVGRRRNR